MNKTLLFVTFAFQAFLFNITNVIIPDYLSSLDLPRFMFGYFIAFWSLGMMVSSPLWGELGDRYGRKKFVILGIVIFGISSYLFYLVDNVFFLLLLRLISGIGIGAPVTLLLSYMVGHSQKGSRTQNLSYRMAFLTIGSTISYFFGGILGLYWIKELFILQSGLSLVFIILILFLLPGKKDPYCAFPKQGSFFTSLRDLKDMNPSILLYLFSIMLTTLTFINIDKFVDLYVIDSGYSTGVLGVLKMTIGIVFISSNFFLVPRFKEYLGNIFILQFFQALMAVIILCVFLYSNVILMLFSLFLGFVVIKALFTTSEQFYLTRQLRKEELGLFMGLRQSFVSLGMIIGPILGGHIYEVSPLHLFVFSVVALLFSSIFLGVIEIGEQKLAHK